MLEKLLQMLAERKALSIDMIAARLQVSQELVLSMVDDLVHMGYLKKAEVTCGECNGCSLHAACTQRGASHAWMLTDAARSLVNRQHHNHVAG
jgi:predicted ArsR family transcriptional regulator